MPVLSAMWTLSVNMKTLSMFVSLLFLPGVLSDCPYPTKIRIITPQKMEALSGSCLKIPCTFTHPPEFDATRDSSAFWLRNHSYGHDKPEYEIYDSRKTDNKYPMKLTGNLQDRNCTTEFYNLTTVHTDTYYFRIISSEFKGTAVCSPLEIVVKDSPASPTLELSADPTALKENQSVTITCSAPTPCPHSPPGLTWSLQHPAHSQMEKNRQGIFSTKIQQDVTLSEKHDGLTISCSAVYPAGGGEKTSETKIQLNVSYAPKETITSISLSGLVSAGTWVTLNCSSRAKPAASYTWFKTSDHGAVRVSEGNFHSFSVTNATDGGVYYCEAHNLLGSVTSERLRLTVAESQRTGLGVFVMLKILGTVALCSSFIILQCWFRRRFVHKLLKDSKSEDYVNAVMERAAS